MSHNNQTGNGCSYIGNLSSTSIVTGGTQIPVLNANQGVDQKVSLTDFINNYLAAALSSAGSVGEFYTQYFSPSGSWNVTIVSDQNNVQLILFPASAGLAGTIFFPAPSTLTDKQEIIVNNGGTLNTLPTYDGNGANLVHIPDGLVVGQAKRFKYDASTSTWYEIT